ncbi:MAG: hypothetical protein ACXV5Q_10830 [Frankiaceae bacterium]
MGSPTIGAWRCPAQHRREDQVWFTATPVEALNFAGGVLLIAADI